MLSKFEFHSETADSNRAEREARLQKDTEIERLQRELKELKVRNNHNVSFSYDS